MASMKYEIEIASILPSLRVGVFEMTYTVSSGTLNTTIPYHTPTVCKLHTVTVTGEQCSRIRILCFFCRFQKNMTFYVFFEMMYQKVVKSL